MTAVSNRNSFSPVSPSADETTSGICPFCGSPTRSGDRCCSKCGSEDSSASRERAKSTVGPWQVLDNAHPSAQGVNFQTLKSWIDRGDVTATSVVRGPTTAQLWKPAGKVKGLSREFGLCYSCDSKIDRSAALCPHCNRSQTLPFDPDMLIDASSPVPMPAPQSPLSTQVWVEETPVRATLDSAVKPARRPIKRDLLLTPGDLAKVFQLNAGPAAVVDHRPRRNRRRAVQRVGRRTVLVLLLIGGTLAAVRETMIASPLAWKFIQQNWLVTTQSSTTAPQISIATPTASPIGDGPAVVKLLKPTISPATPPTATLAGAKQTPATPEVEPADVSPEQKIHELWAQGLSAESERNYKTAVDKYEQILSYPNTFWPAKLSLRLHIAREEAAHELR